MDGLVRSQKERVCVCVCVCVLRHYVNNPSGTGGEKETEKLEETGQSLLAEAIGTIMARPQYASSSL